MPESIVRDESAVEFFREQLVKAMEHQRIATSAFTEHYLVNLLAAFVRGEALPAREPGFDEVPLALLYLRALEATRWERARRLRTATATALRTSRARRSTRVGGFCSTRAASSSSRRSTRR